MAKHILMIGLGTTGFSIAKYLSFKQHAFIAYDTRQQPPRLTEFKAQFPEIEVYCEAYPSSLLDGVAKVIVSPGVAPDCAILRDARAREICIENDLDILADEIKKTRVVAITGSNGKSTVTTWMGEIAKQAGLSVAVGGNLGTPVLDLWLENPNYDVWVLELSSFQLAAVRHFNITASVILNISPDHLDIHGSMENYIRAKQRIYEFSTNLVFNRDDVNTWPKRSDVSVQSFGLSTPIHDNEWGVIQQGQNCYLARGLEIWIDVQQLKLKGQHNWQNALAVCALANLLGIGKKDIVKGLAHFSGLHHRTEWVASLNGVTYINDSKGTNLGASLAAIEGIGPTISGKIILIAGGLAKGADFTPMRQSLMRYVKHVVLIGKDAPLLAQYWQGAVEMSMSHSLEDAVDKVSCIATPGDVVLLSPACASFDMFNGYEHRGQVFSQLVEGIKAC